MAELEPEIRCGPLKIIFFTIISNEVRYNRERQLHKTMLLAFTLHRMQQDKTEKMFVFILNLKVLGSNHVHVLVWTTGLQKFFSWFVVYLTFNLLSNCYEVLSTRFKMHGSSVGSSLSQGPLQIKFSLEYCHLLILDLFDLFFRKPLSWPPI